MDDEFFLLATAVCLYVKKKKPKTKWCKSWLLNRHKHTHINLMKDLRLEPCDWKNYLRMNETAYYHLLELVTPMIKKKDTNMRQSISASERLAATLRFLATGMSYEELKYPTVISAQRLGVIIPETCLALIKCLGNYIKMPRNAEEWENIARGFEEKWNFPHCLGSIDGKHVRINPPPGSGSYYWNYKKFHSMVLMACANANYEFIWCEIGTNGRISDGGAIKNTQFYNKLISSGLGIPPPALVQGTFIELPYVFIGDEAFALRTDFLKPFNKKTLNQERIMFNYRLSRARRVVENLFGIMANRFRIFHTAINLEPHRIDIVVLTCCFLHNFLRKHCPAYIPDDEIEQDSATQVQLTPMENTPHRNASNRAKLVREMFVDYFNGEGEVFWQHQQIT